jgi:hypothetical protein
MTHARASILKTLLEALPPNQSEALMRHLSESEALAIDNAEPLYLDCNEDPIETIHWSWIAANMKEYPLKEKKLFMNILPSSMQVSIGKTFGIKDFKETLSPIGKDFLATFLVDSIQQGKEIIPQEAFQTSRFYKLLKISKKRVIEIVDYLSFYDLSATLRQIVDTKMIKKITSFFSKEDLEMLKKIGHSQTFHPTQPISLKNWDESEEMFKSLLHQRGLLRLAIALSLEHPDFLWHISHKLDHGRGSWLLAKSTQRATLAAVEEIQKQLEKLLAG